LEECEFPPSLWKNFSLQMEKTGQTKGIFVENHVETGENLFVLG